ncbi:sugar ABC transporter ATP-binding protein [Treponema brennaborense]|uniref:Monosaccharide-transporting ATPase n=1 Tax=Treponema brennaborense (strain DSM 12168 / CIP 105900 / DD5/3) TaxID=906968 RepID=F4LMF1_TREBD|nr:sugar ABC transporter ATP-binding protein [Treponema brennaborense]AEE15713.1 Monosaccharide-transporting ATPase [Treponema brennaborense DSM 12168]
MRIHMNGISKCFGEAAILSDVHFSLEPGEIHALMGENGAGKSTLMKILTGVYQKDSGDIFIDDKKVCFSGPKQAEQAGICFVHQELNSLLDMTVQENIFLGRELTSVPGVLCVKRMKRETERILQTFGVAIAADELLGNLSVGQRQMVEIAKAFLVQAEAVILDEPTAALTDTEVDRLFSVVRLLKEKGTSFVYISHRMEEIFRLCDRVTVMRDGRIVGTESVRRTDADELIRLMIGRSLGNLYPKEPVAPGPILLQAEGLSKQGVFRDVSFRLHAGEILGIAGLMGSGRTEIAKTLFGSYRADSGSLYVKGKKLSLHSHTPRNARKLGIAFITEDRKEEGLMIRESIAKNLSLTNFSVITDHRFLISKKKERTLTAAAVSRFRIKCRGGNHICGNLSGGNQQKVVFAKWLFTEPDILILDEPTRGVDVGAKQEIYSIITELVKRGAAVLFISSELPEVIGMSDRIAVVHEGTIAGILERADVSQEKIMALATGGRA